MLLSIILKEQQRVDFWLEKPQECQKLHKGILIFHSVNFFVYFSQKALISEYLIIWFVPWFFLVKGTQIHQAFGQENKWKHGNQLWELFTRKGEYSFANFGMLEESPTMVFLFLFNHLYLCKTLNLYMTMLYSVRNGF